MNLYISTTFLPDNSKLLEALRRCVDVNIKSVEIGSNHCFEKNYNYLDNFDFNFLIHNYFPIPRNSFVLNIASQDSHIRNRSIEHIEKAITLSAKINAKLYTFHPGFLTDPNGSNISNKNYDFQWDEKQLFHSNFEKASQLMYNALDHIILFASKNKVRIAIETEGSLNKKNHLLMQRPEEYQNFMNNYSKNDIGINLNIGHLNLAANAFNFNRIEFVNLIREYICAMELSHNNGIEDEHLPLKENEWYWEIICDKQFENIYKILEFRNTGISEIKSNINLFEEKSSAL